jgi:hypothetical protein
MSIQTFDTKAMKKQKLRLSFGFLLLFASSVVGFMPLKVYGGTDVVQGTSVESSSFSGDTFNRVNQLTPTEPPVGTQVSVEVNGQISLSPPVQERVNEVASKIVQVANADSTSGTNVSTSTSTVISILVQETASNEALNQFQASLSNSGVSQNLIAVLVNNLSGLLKGFSLVDTSGISAAPLQSVQTNGEQVNVNINQLNATIKAYNQIVLKSDAKTLRNLSKNPVFVKSGQVLKELRAALQASQ